MMNVLVKSSNGITLVPVDSKLMANRKIFIEGEIDAEKACECVLAVLLGSAADSQRRSAVLSSAPGGAVHAGMLMYDVIQASKAPIRMFCIGRAYSMGAVLFACGNHGRYMLPHGELMIHEPLLGNRVGGNSSSIKSISDSLLETKRMMNQILAKHNGKSEEVVVIATGFGHYFSPEESVEFGLCDQIVGFDKIMEG